MSLVLEGKIANQECGSNMSGKTKCSKCSKLIEFPENSSVMTSENLYHIHHYINKPYYIYESKSGKAVVYCSKYCRDKHNHRFTKRTEIKEVIRYIFKPDDNRTIEEIVGAKNKHSILENGQHTLDCKGCKDDFLRKYTEGVKLILEDLKDKK